MITILLSFVIGVGSSVTATYLIYLRRRTQYRMRFSSVLSLTVQLGEGIARAGFHPDFIVAVGRNSGIVGSILAGGFGQNPVISVNVTKSRRADGGREMHLDGPSRAAMAELGGTKVLALICCNDSGATLEYVVAQLRRDPHPPQDVRSAALYSVESPGYIAQFNGVILGRDNRMTMSSVLARLPWITLNWVVHPLAQERSKLRRAR